MGRGSSGGGKGSRASGVGGVARGRPRTVVSVGGIDYTKSDRATREGQVLVSVSVSKLDNAWKKDGGYYIDRAGKGSIPGRKEAVERYVKSGKQVNAPEVTYKDGVVSITDGRHRTAVIRD